jgi:diguanylate cyclase (GGDEF)-like protein
MLRRVCGRTVREPIDETGAPGTGGPCVGDSVTTERRAIVGLAALAGVAVIAMLDYTIEANFAAADLYLIPVALTAWFLGRDWVTWVVLGAAMVAFAGIPYATGAAEVSEYLPAVFVHMLHLIIAVVILSFLHGTLARERRLARTDSLTGVSNARHFYDQSRVELDRARRQGNPLSLAYLDVDDFKKVNDRFGHREGDRLLRKTAEMIGSALRSTDVIGRLGGDEFAVLLEGADEETALTVVERIQASLRSLERDHDWRATASVGLVTFREHPERIDEIVGAADELMYEAKMRGKDAVVTGTLNGELVVMERETAAPRRTRPVTGTRPVAGTGI